MKALSILGSTGSIGTQSLDIVRRFPEQFKVAALSCNSNIGLLKKQLEEFKPKVVAVFDDEKADELEDNLKGGLNSDVSVCKGMKGLLKAATLGEVDTVVNSLVGSVGILPTVKAIENLKNVALANKETLVSAGRIVMEKLNLHKTDLLPIDSEHSAILQCLRGEKIGDVDKVILTCSGGAFRDKSKEELMRVRATDALNHPTWKMGAKITIDCATLMNKGFEVIEAHWLYGLPYSKIDVVMHPQSIIHSLVEFKDKSIIAQLGIPDMRIPIQYALVYPKRLENPVLPQLNLNLLKEMSFFEPDLKRFPCLAMAYDCGIKGGSIPSVMNAANEIAVEYFLRDQIGFIEISGIIMEMINRHRQIKAPSLDEVLEIDKRVKEDTRKLIEEGV